jgi:hypothetical protein
MKNLEKEKKLANLRELLKKRKELIIDQRLIDNHLF